MWRKQVFCFSDARFVGWRIGVLATAVFITCHSRAQNTAGIPRPDHVVIVVEENRGLVGVIGASDAPYINSLAAQGALLTEYYAIAHPSQPNYLALFSGSTQGVSDDSCPHTFATPNLGKGLLDAGLTFAGYAESLPGVGSTSCESGPYARKHVPWVNFVNVPARSNLPFSQFPSDFNALPAVSFVIPNEDNDMHSGSTQAGDNWLRNHLDAYVQWARTNNSLLIVTFDEGGPLNQVATLFVGPMVQPGTYCARVTHYNLLRTLEDMFGLAYAGHSANVPPIANIWRSGDLPPQVEMTSPATGTTLSAGGNLILAADVTSGAGAIAKVEFFSGVKRLGEVATAPYTLTWSNVPAGSSCLSAKVTDVLGQVSASASIPVTVTGETANPFALVKGTYSGLIPGSAETGITNSGWFTLNVTARGALTGRLRVGGTKDSLRGKFDESGSARVSVTRAGQASLTIELGLDLSGTTDQVTGSVSDGTWSAPLEGERVMRAAAEIAGKYAVLISAPDGMPALPGGNGSGTANVSPSGQIRFNVGLGDGTHATGTGRLTTGNRWPFYAPLSNGHGTLSGWIDFDPGTATLTGKLVWLSDSGFTTIASVSGSR